MPFLCRCFDMQSEINDSMAYSPAESLALDYTTADLEEELNDILAASDEPGTTSPAAGIQKPRSPVVSGNKKVSPGRTSAKASPSLTNIGLPSVPSEPLISGSWSPQGYSGVTPPRVPQYGLNSNISPRLQDHPQYDSGELKRTFTLEESNSPSQISGASSSLDSYGLSSNMSDSDVSKQFEALRVMEGSFSLWKLINLNFSAITWSKSHLWKPKISIAIFRIKVSYLT